MQRVAGSPLRVIGRQRLPNIRLGNPKLSCNSRWRDASLECGANCIYLTLGQRDFGNVPLSFFIGQSRPFRRQL